MMDEDGFCRQATNEEVLDFWIKYLFEYNPRSSKKKILRDYERKRSKLYSYGLKESDYTWNVKKSH